MIDYFSTFFGVSFESDILSLVFTIFCPLLFIYFLDFFVDFVRFLWYYVLRRK